VDDESPIFAEARALIDALLDDRVDAAAAARLEQLVVSRPDVARFYLRCMHLRCSIPHHVTTVSAELLLDAEETEPLIAGGGAEALSHAMVMPAVHEEDLADDDEESFAEPPPTVVAPVPRKPWWTTRGGRYAAAAAVLLVASVVLTLLLRPAAPMATLTATAGVTWDLPADAAELRPGATLKPGRVVRLQSGAVELAFASGATVLLEGPATFRIVDRMGGVLQDGKLAAHVPPQAKGFRVTCAQLRVDDLGTGFGLNVPVTGPAEVHVFEGNVDVRPSRADGTTASEVTHLHADQAVRYDPASSGLKTIVAAPDSFVRDVSQVRRPLPLHGTGYHVAIGATDSRWLVLPGAEATTAPVAPQPAVVMAALEGIYIPGDPDHAQWVTLPSVAPVAAGATFTLRTSIDLTGFDPATVSLRARVAVDDGLSDVRVNGVSTGLSIPIGIKPNRAMERDTILDLKGHFRSGLNDVEFVIVNKEEFTTNGHVALLVEWTATACPLVTR
jgi:hypothetical protein